jgi:hypothetical protein
MAIDRITTGAVLDGAIATADIADDAVTGAKIENNPTVAGNLATGGTLAIAGHGSIGNAGTVAGTRALTVVGATDGTSSQILVGYNSSLSSKFSVRDDGYTTVGAGMNVQGNISVPSSSGIDFSGHANAAGMTSELLDDYEEGTWTPAVSTASTHHARVGIYTKIGNMVHIQCSIDFTQSGTTHGSISGLPYVVTGVNYTGITFREWYSTGITMSGNLSIGGQSTSGFWNYVNNSAATNGQRYGYAFSTTYRT